MLGVLGAGLALCLCVAIHARHANGGPGFPLDDAWIHLQFARTLHDHGSFSYYKDEMATAGSTSPLYTLLLAAGFFVTQDEFALSHGLGILFLLAGGALLFLVARHHGGEDRLLAPGAALLMMIEPRLIWAALSGMETTLFIALLLAALYAYTTRRYVALGVAAGLLLWARPEALLFIGALVVDIGYHACVTRRDPGMVGASAARRPPLDRLRKSLLILLGIGAAYAVFNMMLSGSLLPNTYAAKTKYYATGGGDFPLQALRFATGGHMIVVAILAGLGAAAVIGRLWRRQPAEQLVVLLWPVLMCLAYWYRLPYLYQEGRYLMPILPAILLLAVGGVRAAFDAAGGWRRATPDFSRLAPALRIALLAIIALQFAAASWRMRIDYADQCRYIGDRQVRAARWLAAHLPEGSVVATHDIGAIAFYSGLRVVDLVGLVSPERIDSIGRLDTLPAYLVGHGVTHLAVLRNWFEIVNQDPIFQTDPRLPEIMEIFEFRPQTTHFTPPEVSAMTAVAREHLETGDLRVAGPLLQEAVRIDPASARTHLLLGQALIAAGRFAEAAQELEAARRLQPSSSAIAMAIARLAGQGR